MKFTTLWIGFLFASSVLSFQQMNDARQGAISRFISFACFIYLFTVAISNALKFLRP